jgi:hypothetical protein
MLSRPLSDDWEAFGTLHNLCICDVESLMMCRQIALTEDVHLVLLRDQLHRAIVERDHGRVQSFLCLLIRAKIDVNDDIGGLAFVVLDLALRNDEKALCAEAVCVRLARVLAVKLDELVTNQRLTKGSAATVAWVGAQS